MTPYYERDGVTLYCGDNREVLPALDVAVSAVVTDPPYGLSFMGKAWDHGVPGESFWRIIGERMTPGAHLLAFGGTRTFHRIAVAIEDAGFDIKDTLSWLYGSGFPKHKSLLKPAWEPVILARKPGKGVLNIDACRIEASADDPNTRDASGHRQTYQSDNGWSFPAHARTNPHDRGGRWPANVLLDEDAAALLDAMSGVLKTHGGGTSLKTSNSPVYQHGGGYVERDQRFNGDTGGASRFFYVAKASRRERNAGLDGMPEHEGGAYANGAGMPGRTFRDGEWVQTGSYQEPNRTPRANHHPTVKPLALMRWLVTLVTPPGGIVLDPFAGSGTTGVACAELGVPCILIEQDPEYCEIIARRVDHALNERAGRLPLAMCAD